jgi:diketogulonate reductase-like aldo/keto reductase
MVTTRPRAIELNNGVEMPAIGLGVFQSPPNETVRAVETAIATGYRLIDTAASYGNEGAVGEAIRRSGVDRSELFVTTKLWISDYGYRPALRALNASLRRLDLDYIDLYLLHWPLPSDFGRTVASYEAAEAMLAEGRARAIGISNFDARNLDELVPRIEVVPAVNQVELHPYFAQRDLRDANNRYGIVTQSWSPLGGIYAYGSSDPTAVRHPLDDPLILELAKKYGKTPAQVILRWHIHHGLSAIPKSVRVNRIKENFDVFDFALTPNDVTAIDALDTRVRGGVNPQTVDTELFPFVVEND